MHYLLIAEKPSLMREIKDCYENHKDEIISKVGEITFLSLSGHACRNAEPDEYQKWTKKRWGDVDYPMVPDEWLIKPIKDKNNLLKEVKNAAKETDGIIVATDSDVEGYGIYWLVEHYLGLMDKPALRFIEHSLTDKEILQSLLSMTDYHTDNTHVNAAQSFLIRSRADWLFGMNLTRMMSVKCGDTMRIGRVKAPTIRLVYDNSMAIENFVPETYLIKISDYGDFKGVLCDEKGNEIRFKSDDDTGVYPSGGTVRSVTTKRAKTPPPKLFDLTTAQAEAGRLFGFSPSHTLSIIQSLYEDHKVISYPRTQCKYVSSEKAKEFPLMLAHMGAFRDLWEIKKTIPEDGYSMAMKNTINDKEVAKESHDALLPTSIPADPEKMTEDEKKVCHMIYARFLAQFLPAAEEDNTTAVIEHGDGLFYAKGKTVITPGWRILYTEAKEAFLPLLKEDDKITAVSISDEEKTTKAPKRLTQHSLIHAMENIASLIKDKDLQKSLADSKGIGTAATRANIISEIVKSGYVEEIKKGLYITELGKRYVKSLTGVGIDSPEFAAVLDTRIKRVQRGEDIYNNVYSTILDDLNNMCDKVKTITPTDTGLTCPVCGAALTNAGNMYLCTNTEACGAKFVKYLCGTQITPDMMISLSAGEKIGPYSFTSKKKKKFSARIYIENGSYAFDFSSGVTCPICGNENVQINAGGAFCGCGLKLFRKTYGGYLTDAQLKKLITNGKTDKINNFVSKKTGKKYSGILYLNKDTKTSEIRFPSSGTRTKGNENI